MAYDGVSRRHFFFGTLLAGAVPAGGFGSVPSLRALGYKPFYDKLNVAAIGCGGQGGVDLNDAARTENIVALCDVDENRAAANFKKFEKQPKYKDFRVMLDKEGKNIDACTIGIPDFMHATAALACMQRGKHVYLEKPLTRTPWEARLLRDAALKYKVATQMGNQGFSHECNRVVAEIVWSGAIGDVLEAHISATPGTHPTGMQEAPPEESVPGTLDWNLWLGGATMRPFSSYYVPYNWRGFPDFGTGQIGNWATHTAGPVHTALQLGAPTSVECISLVGKSRFSYPERGVVRLDFPARGGMPAVKVFYHDSAKPGDAEAYHVPGMDNETILPPTNNLADKGRPGVGRGAAAGGGAPARGGERAAPRNPAQGAGGPGVRVFGTRGDGPQPGILTGNGSVFIGTKGIMATASRGEGVHLLPESRWKDYVLPPQLLTRSPGHMLDWIRACKGGDPGCSEFSISAPYAEWLTLAVIAFRVPGKLEWDAKNLRFTNSPEANQFVKPVFRHGWELKAVALWHTGWMRGSVLFILGAAALLAADGPQFTADGQLRLPANYREWVFVTSGLGMTYGSPESAQAREPRFDNVFVTREAYSGFLATGQWPDKTMFVLEVRTSQSKASINNGGRFQSDIVAIEAEVKNGGKWAFYGFGTGSPTGKQIPATASCYSCHSQHGAVDNTFVQFYPTLLSVARAKGTLKP